MDGTKGQSATQKTLVHSVQIGNYAVRLFDTPGIGDTRGAAQDTENMADILSVLSNYEKLHGILILLKPNNSRLTLMFRFCIKELLTHLHRDATQNMVFGFTNTRGSNYKPGDTFAPLKIELGYQPLRRYRVLLRLRKLSLSRRLSSACGSRRPCRLQPKLGEVSEGVPETVDILPGPATAPSQKYGQPERNPPLDHRAHQADGRNHADDELHRQDERRAN